MIVTSPPLLLTFLTQKYSPDIQALLWDTQPGKRVQGRGGGGGGENLKERSTMYKKLKLSGQVANTDFILADCIYKVIS